MEENFEKALKFLVSPDIEGGISNHPSDRGGLTNRGVTQGTYNQYRLMRGLSPQSVRHITSDEVRDLYYTLFWRKVRAGDLPSGVDVVAFDFAVNSGCGRVVTYLTANPNCTIEQLLEYRVNFYKKIGVGSQAIFLKGWLNRIEKLRRFCHGLV